MRKGGHRVCLYRENSSRPVRHHLEEGELLPLDRGAARRVLSAFSMPSPSTSQSEPQAPRDLEDQVRLQGYYISRGERDPDATAVAVPASDQARDIVGALTISGVRARLTEPVVRRALKALKRDATELRRSLPRSDGTETAHTTNRIKNL